MDKLQSVMKQSDGKAAAIEAVTLEEEDYLDEMGEIIERDFFPQLSEFRKLESSDNSDSIQLPIQNSPETFETPSDAGPLVTNVETPEPEFVKPEPVKPKISLNQFCRLVKNRENEDFKEILEKTERKRKEGKAWMYNVKAIDVEKRLVVPSIKEQAKGIDRPLDVDTWAHTVHNPLMFHPSGVSQEDDFTRDKSQEIVHANTSFKSEPFDGKQNQDLIQRLASARSSTVEGKIGIDGKIVTPKRENQTFVPLTPSPRPGYCESPIMTYGQLESTPLRIERTYTNNGVGFSMQPIPKRERIALELEKASTEKLKAQKTPSLTKEWRRLGTSPRSIFSRTAASNTPKGKVLQTLLKSGCPPSPWDRPRTDQTYRRSQTPSPFALGVSLKRKTTSTIAQPVTVPSTDKDLTDNLLQLPLLPRSSKPTDD